MEGVGHHTPSSAASERLHLQSPGSRAQLLVIVSPGVRAASARRSRAQPSRKKGQLLPPPLLLSRLEAGRALHGTMDPPWAPHPPDNYPTRPCESTTAKPPWGQCVTGGSKAEEKLRVRARPGSRGKRNPTSQSLPHDLSSPLGPGNLMGCDTRPGLQEGVAASRDAEC